MKNYTGNQITNEKSIDELLNEILYDGTKPKLRMYLVRWNVPKYDLEDLESEIILHLLKSLKKGEYHYNKVSFEKWISNSIFQLVMNYFQSKNLLKNHSKLSIEGVVEESDFNDYPKQFGYSEIDEVEIDVENIFCRMTQRQSFICRCAYYSGWKKHEIIDYLGIDTSVYKKELKEIEKILMFHL